MPQNNDNLLAMALQVAMSRAHPSPIPSNYVLTLIEGPNDPAQLGDTVTTTLTDTASLVYGALVTFGSAADWQSCTLSYADATTRPGSVILTNYGTYSGNGTAQTPSIDLTAAASVSGATLTIYTDGHATFSDTSITYQVRFSADGSTWGAYQTLTNGATFTPERYCEVLVTLNSTDGVNTPQVNSLRFSVATPALWGQAEWSGSKSFMLGLLPG